MRKASAARPPGVDPNDPLSIWFDAQYNTQGRHCCGVGDGLILDDDDWRGHAGRYEVRINGKWLPVPGPDAGYYTADVKPGNGPNPTGKAVVWTSDRDRVDVEIYCFIPGTLS